jgi:membrane protein
MPHERFRQVVARLTEIVTQPRSELTRWQRTARYAYDLGRVGARQLRQDNAPQMAGALAFRTLFGMLPVAVVGTILVRAFRGTDGFHTMLVKLLEALELDEIRVSSQRGAASAASVVDQTLSDWLLSVITHAEQLNIAAIGWAGTAVLLYAAIGLMITIERSFNTIYRAASGRAWLRRLTTYWSVLTLSSLAIGGVAYADARFDIVIASIHQGQWLAQAASAAWGLLVTWLILLALYLLVPNTSVALRPALVGALVAALLVELGKRTLGAYLSNMLSVHLWGSLGLIPIFMFWIYVMWLAVLFGLEVAATLQMLGRRQVIELAESPRPPDLLVDPAGVVGVMEVVAAHFAHGRSVGPRSISEATGLPEPTVDRMLHQLAVAGFVHRLSEGAVALARPPEQITADQLIDVGFGMVAPPGRAGGATAALVERLRGAQRDLAAAVTLARLG